MLIVSVEGQAMNLNVLSHVLKVELNKMKESTHIEIKWRWCLQLGNKLLLQKKTQCSDKMYICDMTDHV